MSTKKKTSKRKKTPKRRLRKWNSDVEGMDRLLQEKALSHTRGFFHYTILRHLAKMLTLVKIGEKECLLMKMSPAESLNDNAENSGGKKAYVLSLLHGPEESVAMWAIYGVPRKEAVRIRLCKKDIAAWLKKTKRDRSSVFFVKKGVDSNAQYEAIEPARIRLADVLYVVRKDSKSSFIAEHDGIPYKTKNHHSWIDFASEKSDIGLDLFFKNRGWAYERETRLVVEFEKAPAEIDEPIYVDFTNVLKVLRTPKSSSGQSSNRNILLGPWFDETLLDDRDGKSATISDSSFLKSILDCNNLSSYKGELRMSTKSKYCNQMDSERQTGKSCDCPYNDQ